MATDPRRLPTMMPASVFEEFVFGIATAVLSPQHRQHTFDIALGGLDTLLGVLFLVAFFPTSARMPSQA